MQQILVITLFICSFAYSGHGISCYSCRSDTTPGCGVTLTVPERLRNSLIVECNETLNPTGCEKLTVNEYTQEVIIRGCNYKYDTPAKDYVPLGCGEYQRHSICHCLGDGCNGQTSVVSSVSVLLLGLLMVIFLTR